VLPLTALTLFISGAALFTYQMLWIRLLGFTEDTSFATTLLALFIGMALGGLLAQWRLKKGLNGLKAFIFTQILIAISTPLLLPQLISPEQIEFFYGSIALFLILLIPSTALGMAFPLLTSWLATYKPNNHSVSFLYGFMLLGGVAGMLLSGLYIIPALGLDGAIHSAAVLNLLAALMAVSLYLKTNSLKISPPLSLPSQTNTIWQPFRLLIILALISFVTMGSSVVWSKFISLYAGTTLFSLTVILATILLGTALGALLMQQWQNKQKIRYKHLFSLLIILFIALNITRYLLSEAPQLYSSSQYLGELLNYSDALIFALMIFIPSLLLGAITALSLSLYCQTPYKVQQNIGLAYSTTLLAAITGGIVTALWLIPKLGSNPTLLIFASTPLLLALLLIPNIRHVKKNIARYSLIAILGIASLFIPNIHFPDLFKQHYYRYIDTLPLVDFYLEEGKAGLIGFTLHEMKSSRLKINGLIQSKVLAHRAYKGESSEILAGALPYLLQNNATNALVLGFQTGITTRVLAKSDLEGVVKTVEPEPKTVEAMMVLNLLVNFPFLEDGRVDIEYNDFRTALREDSESYSIIATQAPYAWLTGATQLYSQEFFNLVKMRLKEDGLFSYHFSLLRMDTQALKSILKTFYSVFPTGAVFSDLDNGNLILLGGNKPLIMDFKKTQAYYKIQPHYESASAAEMLRFSGIRNPKELPRALLFSSIKVKKLVKEAKIITDTNLLIETRIEPLSKKLPKGEHDPYEFIKQSVQKTH
jgi:predicted membrane-bound spermidine synthase